MTGHGRCVSSSLRSFLVLSPELPWDAPSPKCKPFAEWCSHNFLLSPWNKISNEPLGEYQVVGVVMGVALGVALSVALGVDGVCMCMSGCMAGCRYT